VPENVERALKTAGREDEAVNRPHEEKAGLAAGRDAASFLLPRGRTVARPGCGSMEMQTGAIVKTSPKPETDIVLPERLPFLESLSWSDRGYRDLPLLDILRRSAPTRKRDGTWGYLDLFRASSVPIRRHVKIRAEATEFDPAYEDYFRDRWVRQQQRRRRRRAKARELAAMGRVNPDNPTAGSRNRPTERLEPYAGKLARTVLRGAGGS
jgi:hypothetical protein